MSISSIKKRTGGITNTKELLIKLNEQQQILVSEQESKLFDRNVRIQYDPCQQCGRRKDLDNICLGRNCGSFFKLVCGYCHRLDHQRDQYIKYQFQDIDAFLHEVVKMVRIRKNFAQTTIDEGVLQNLIDKRVKEIDDLVNSITEVKNLLLQKKQALNEIFNDYDFVYDELKKLYMPGGQFMSLPRSLSLLSTKLDYPKNSSSDTLIWNSEQGLLETFFKPLNEQQILMSNKKQETNTPDGQQHKPDLRIPLNKDGKKFKQVPSAILELEQENMGSMASSLDLESAFMEPFNIILDQIQIATQQMKHSTESLFKQPLFEQMVESDINKDFISNLKTECVKTCNNVLKQADIHYQWDSFAAMQKPETSLTSIAMKFCSILLTRPYYEDEGEEMKKPNLELMFETYFTTRNQVTLFEKLSLRRQQRQARAKDANNK